MAVMAVVLLGACSSSKTAVKSGNTTKEVSNTEAYVKKVTDNFQTAQYITAKASVELKNGTKSIGDLKEHFWNHGRDSFVLGLKEDCPKLPF